MRPPASAVLTSLLALAVIFVTTPAGQPARAESRRVGAAAAPVVVAAGDIACGTGRPERGECHERATSDLVLDLDPDAVLTLGDLQYERGQIYKFQERYDPTWGRFRDLTRPSPGNHEYGVPNARGYFRYFGHPSPYYSFDLGAWHLISLNSQVDHDDLDDDQVEWLQRDLDDTDARCVLAYWHEPLYSTASRYVRGYSTRTFWEVLYAEHADLVLSGHAHNYERFARQNPRGKIDGARGIREFVVGTGGKSLNPFRGSSPASQFRTHLAFGVLKLTLWPRSYVWSFVTEDGRILDTGRTYCR